MLLFSVAVGIVLFLSPVPDGLSTEAWQLFAIFGATILCVLTGGTTLFLAAILALVAAVLTGTLDRSPSERPSSRTASSMFRRGVV